MVDYITVEEEADNFIKIEMYKVVLELLGCELSYLRV